MNGDANDRPFRPVLESLELLLEPGAVAELRAIGADGQISSGYFDRPARLATAAEVLDDTGEYQGIYVTLNPVHPALHARRANRVKRRLGRKDATTADGDIPRRRWLPIDIDPARPSGVSSTGEEHRAAGEAAQAVRDFLTGQGWPAPIVADSGNGAHLLYRIDLPNDAASTELVRAVLVALDARFPDGGAKVDTANYNAARIWKLYGTVSRKGDSTEDRPHRRSAIVSRPHEPEVVSASLLRAVAASLPAPEPPAPAAAAPARRPGGGLDLGAWLREHGVAIAAERPWQGGMLYTLARCPFSDAHADGAYAIQFGNGAIHAGCKHESCGGGRQRWRELRERFEPRPPATVVPPAAETPAPAPRAGDRTAPEARGPPEDDPAVAAAATEVLERGDPAAYFLAAFARDHVGDETLARCLIMSLASQAVLETRGLHVYVTGESGKGKSSGMTAMLRQVPEEYRLAERMSNKALYYSDDISPGTVLLLDDIGLSDELQEVLKEATSKFTEPVRMRSVDAERKVRRYTIPERCAWWLANVSALYDDQVLNRMLVCWVDDSEEQDREVFRRTMAERARRAGGDAERFDLRVCREMWRRLRADGPVRVDIPFAGRIRMASVRNRRNPAILLDLVAGHALLRRFQRPAGDGEPAVEATEEDFRAAAALFAELHAAGGSLEAKFDRNEEVVLDLAARYGVEQFTLRDAQRWTGWSYHKARRIMVGRNEGRLRYPGLLDKSPSLSVLDRTTNEEDNEGRAATNRQLVFLFDPEVYRETRASGLAWLEPEETPSSHDGHHGKALVRPLANPGTGPGEGGSSNGGVTSENEKPVYQDPETTLSDRTVAEEASDRPASEILANRKSDLEEKSTDAGSAESVQRAVVAKGLARPLTRALPGRDHGNSIDPRQFVPTGAPVREPCNACGHAWSHHREKRGGPGRLCKQCFARAAERERRRCPPLPAVIDPAVMRRAGAAIGRCDVCGLEPARWHGDGGRLCDGCFRREVRRGLGRGEGVPAEA